MKLFFYISFLVFCTFLISCDDGQLVGDVLIQNGTIYDGSGSLPYKGDILIDGDSIKWIGIKDEVQIECHEIIDASDHIISPGFIDIHSHGSPISTPEFENFLAMGVSSISLGMDGSSTTVEDLDDWFHSIDSIQPGVNILPFIGHGTLREESGIGHSNQVNAEALKKMTSLLEKALSKGVWGLSMGLEYLPGYYADSLELLALAKSTGRYNSLITSHIRNEDNDQIKSSLEEMFSLSNHCNINISHLKVVFAKGEKRAKEVLDLFELQKNKKYSITADLYPYTASYTGIGIVFPEWAKRPKTYGAIKKQRRSELLNHLRNRVNSRNGPEATLFGTAPYKGKSLKDLEDEYKIPFEEVLADVIGPYGGSAAFFVMDEDLQKELIKHPSIMVASDGSPTMYHPRGHGTFSKILESFVIKDSTLNLTNALYKMTGLPAKTLGLQKRGFIESGMKADLLIFKPEDIKSEATFQDPHKLAKGMKTVMISGEIVFENEQIIKRKGRVLLKGR